MTGLPFTSSSGGSIWKEGSGEMQDRRGGRREGGKDGGRGGGERERERERERE